MCKRMKRTWREADRQADANGTPVSRTLGSSQARREWFEILTGVLLGDDIIRIRHRYYDEPAILIRESLFRRLE